MNAHQAMALLWASSIVGAVVAYYTVYPNTLETLGTILYFQLAAAAVFALSSFGGKDEP